MQKEFLEAAAALTKPGGLLVYAVCSQEAEEGEKQINAFLEQQTEFTLSPVTKDDLPFVPEAITQEGWVRTFPTMMAEKGGMDGFFFAKLRREKS